MEITGAANPGRRRPQCSREPDGGSGPKAPGTQRDGGADFHSGRDSRLPAVEDRGDMLQSNGGVFSGTFERRGIIRGGGRPHVNRWQIFVGFSVGGGFQRGGEGRGGGPSANRFFGLGRKGCRRRRPGTWKR